MGIAEFVVAIVLLVTGYVAAVRALSEEYMRFGHRKRLVVVLPGLTGVTMIMVVVYGISAGVEGLDEFVAAVLVDTMAVGLAIMYLQLILERLIVFGPTRAFLRAVWEGNKYYEEAGIGNRSQVDSYDRRITDGGLR
jgi:hypothetical protein